MAFACKPQVLIADEPTKLGGISLAAAEVIMDFLARCLLGVPLPLDEDRVVR
jgi:ABC-type dipeptide/oligopeptide/nickel transport system ATPase component